MDTYTKGHLFELEVIAELQEYIPECLCYHSILLPNPPYYETDIILVKDKKVLLVECKDLEGDIYYDDISSELFVGNFQVDNFLRKYNRKVNLFKRYGVNTKCVVITRKETTSRSLIPITKINKLAKLIKTLPDSNIQKLNEEVLNLGIQNELHNNRGGWR